MKPITLRIPTSKGDVTAEIGQFKTVYGLDGYKYQGINKLLLQFIEPERVRAHILQLERAELLRHYAAASEPRTVDSMLVELSDRGLETTRLQIPCIGGECEEVCVEETEAPMRLDEVSVLAEEASGFVDGLCGDCHDLNRRENAQADFAREQHESREDQCNEQSE